MPATSRISIPSLRRMLKSQDSRHRIMGLRAMRRQISGGQPKTYISMARKLFYDRSENCRWQSAIVVGSFIDHHPETVWDVVDEYILHGVRVAQDPIATVLVEHLLERDFPRYFNKLRHLGIEQREMVKDLLARCWAFGDAEKHWSQVISYLKDES